MKYTIELQSKDISSLCRACTHIQSDFIKDADDLTISEERREQCARSAEYWGSLRANIRKQWNAAMDAADAAREAKQAANQEQEAPAQDTAEIMQQAVTLPQRVALYVPGTQGADTATDNAAQVERVAAEFSRMFGGATAQESNGFWMSNTAGLVRETVTIVYANCTADQLRERLPDVLTLAQQIKREMAQEAVSAEINGTLYII
jgi:hypothetical protein